MCRDGETGEHSALTLTSSSNPVLQGSVSSAEEEAERSNRTDVWMNSETVAACTDLQRARQGPSAEM